jgi:hypothetical protein
MNRSSPAGADVEHVDPEMKCQRAWLLAGLERRVALESQPLD